VDAVAASRRGHAGEGVVGRQQGGSVARQRQENRIVRTEAVEVRIRRGPFERHMHFAMRFDQ